MDPRIGWHPNELMNNALSTWANAWMNSQTQTQTNLQINSLSTPNLLHTVHPTLIHNQTTNDLLSMSNSPAMKFLNPDMDRDQREILNNLRTNRKFNKASTYGFNLPTNQHMLEDPMSTPWMMYFNTLTPNRINISNSRSSSVLSTSSTSLTSSSSSTSSSSAHNDDIHNESHFSPDEDSEYTSEGLLNLHKEILLFSDYITPTFEELYMRNEIIMRVTKVIKEKYPEAEVDVFGSYKTGLFLPTSDIDMVVIGEWKTLPLNNLKEALIKDGISDHENIKCLDKATVPIIKILETNTELKVDISFNTVNGVKSAELIKKFLIEYPCLRPLVMVLKQFLIQRDYNEVWTGGIGSYSLILMTVSFLQLHPRIDARSLNVNLGVLLIEFFEFYGRCFNYMKTAIRIQNGGCYLPKDEILKQFTNTVKFPQSSVLCIEDPLNPLNDIGKGSYGALKVKQAFEYAYFTLSHAVLPQNEFIIKNSPQSILGRIIRITKEVRDYRSWVKKTYEKHVSFELAKSFFILNSNYNQVKIIKNDNDRYEKKPDKFLSTITNQTNSHHHLQQNNINQKVDNSQNFVKKENQENRQITKHNNNHHNNHRYHYNNNYHNHNHHYNNNYNNNHHNNHYNNNYYHNHHNNHNHHYKNKKHQKMNENLDINKKVKFHNQETIDRSETFSSASSTTST